MSKAKWIMKQYWRIGAIRALASLGLGMLVLGRYYYIYVPVLNTLEWMGAIILGMALTFLFLGIGWVYDQKAKMWSQKLQVAAERNPYYYVPNLKNLAVEYPVLYTVLDTIKNALEALGLDSNQISELVEHQGAFYDASPNKHDINDTKVRSEIFMSKYPFTSIPDEPTLKVPISSRLKLGWETQMIRLNWIQSLTGLAQDVLIFGALYVVIVFPGVPQELELLLAVAGISLPMLLVLTILGWYYDRRLRMWSVDTAVHVERNPYTYVAEPYLYSRIFPFFLAFLSTTREILKVKDLQYEDIDNTLSYLAKYGGLSVSRTKDFDAAQELRKSLGVLFQSEDTRS